MKNNGINVLSLFDGISCGKLALERAKVNINNYYASEINKHAIKVSKDNNKDIIHLGDINKWNMWDIDWSSIDLILAGSPCQGFSFSGKHLAFEDPRSILFFKFVDILKHIKKFNPNVKFLLENVRMKKEYENIITSILNVKPVLIDSALVSAQRRRRLYWCNWIFPVPKDKKIELDFVLFQIPRGVNRGSLHYLKSPTLTTSCWEFNNLICSNDWINWFLNNKKNQKKNDSIYDKNGEYLFKISMKNKIAKWGNEIFQIDKSTFTKIDPIEFEKLQTLPINYTSCISNSQRYKCIGNAWTVDIISHILKYMR